MFFLSVIEVSHKTQPSRPWCQGVPEADMCALPDPHMEDSVRLVGVEAIRLLSCYGKEDNGKGPAPRALVNSRTSCCLCKFTAPHVDPLCTNSKLMAFHGYTCTRPLSSHLENRKADLIGLTVCFSETCQTLMEAKF